MAAFWYVLVGGLLIAIALLGRFLDRMPVSPAMIYLVVGFLLGPAAFNVLELHPLRELTLLESITEIGTADRAVHRGHQDACADRRLALERAAAAGHDLDGGDHRRHSLPRPW
jgi:hypothetical protein